jgi:hypothetical protein
MIHIASDQYPERHIPAFTGRRQSEEDKDPSYVSDEDQHMESDDEDEEEEYMPNPVLQNGQALLSEEAKRNNTFVPVDDDVSVADDEMERAIMSELVSTEGVRRRKLKVAGQVWKTAENYKNTYAMEAERDEGVGPVGSIDKQGVTKTILPMLAKEKCVADFGHGCGAMVLAISTRHIAIGFEVVPARYEYSQRLHAYFIKKKFPLNPLKLGTHKHTSPACPVYAVFYQY